MKPRLMILTVILIACSFTLGGCNLFGWTSGGDTESLVEEGNRLMRDGKFTEAVVKFAEAMEKDPNDSEARYYHAKATLRASGFNALTLGTEMTETAFADGDGLPFSGGTWTQDKTSKLYKAISTVYEDLRPIYYDSTTGKISKSEVDIDYAISAGIRGILIFQNSSIDEEFGAEDFGLSIKYGGGEFQIQNLFTVLTNQPAPTPPLKPRPEFSTSPTLTRADSIYACARIPEFNAFLDNIAAVIQESLDIITTILTEELGIDPAEVQDLLNQVIAMAHKYKVNDPADNDNDGTANEEVIDGLDNDSDGFTDEDSVFDCTGL